jgi:hypothetical protein
VDNGFSIFLRQENEFSTLSIAELATEQNDFLTRCMVQQNTDRRGGEETRERVRDMSVPNTTSRPPVRRMFVHNPRSGMRLASLFVLAQFSAWLLFVAPFLLFFFPEAGRGRGASVSMTANIQGREEWSEIDEGSRW